ncbi:MAG: PVC-type heme-binding CxxCH protein [Verrucomicrobiales bacterium]
MRKLFQLFCGIGFGATLLAQNGDKPGEVQGGPPPGIVIPEAPALQPDEAIKTFKVPSGFKVELVASEPLIEAPVEIEFAPDGRIYVVEMRGFMRNVEGKGEDEPIGRVSVLEDTDGDGQMDKTTVFADNLVMPRAIALVRGGLLVGEPPHLWFYQDKDGDGKAETRTEVASDYGSQANPEHTANGLMLGLDNWIYNANHTVRYRFDEGKWIADPVFFTSRGQWGMTQDDVGRLFFNSNSDQLRADLIPAEYLRRNKQYKSPFGGNVQTAPNQAVWPGRVNPGVNRGYQRGTLRPDGTLANFTGACGPVIYRGDIFPERYRGAAFLAEPTANLIRCNILTENDGIIRATNALDKAEFLTSTDERFRPVNLNNGPDGALYIVDMYRGVLQHRIYLTTYLRKQALERGLDKPIDMGRIYRIVPTEYIPVKVPPLSQLSPQQLTQALADDNGWRRDKAQQMLIEKNLPETVPALTSMVKRSRNPLGSLHALWTLEGMKALSPEALLSALNHEDERVQAAGIRLSEPYLRAEGRNEVSNKVLSMVEQKPFSVRLQLMLSLGEKPGAEGAMLKLLNGAGAGGNPLIRSAAISGLGGREVEFMKLALQSDGWTNQVRYREDILKELALCVVSSGSSERINEVLNLAANAKTEWATLALLDGMNSILPPKGRNASAAKPKQITLKGEPAAFAVLGKDASPAMQERLETLHSYLTWEGKAGATTEVVKPLTAEQQKMFEAGKETSLLVCGARHQPHGQGQEGLAPPLADVDWVTGSPERLVRITLHGVRGPISVKGKTYNLEMPPVGVLEDQQIAEVLTYIRREWGHTASPIDVDFVKKIREATKDREEAWTEPELLKVK